MNNNIHIGKLIHNKLKENDRSVSWLAKKIYCDPSALCKMLKREDINTKLLLKISKILDHDFFVYYSNTISNSDTAN